MKSVHHHSSYLLTLFLIVSTGPNVTSADNLALNKPATQEGIYNNQGASLAVDGDPNSCSDGDPNSCSFSNYGFGLPTWWQVDLLYESYITSASIQIPTSDDVAHSMSATQSYTYDNNVAGLAVDGDLSTCSITSTTDGSIAWWQVDLEDLYTVINVTILASSDPNNAAYLTGFAVEVSSMNHTDSFPSTELCNTYNSTSITTGSTLNITCTAGLVGRYVTIKRNGGTKPTTLTLCEVHVSLTIPSSGLITTSTTSSTTAIRTIPGGLMTASNGITTTNKSTSTTTTSLKNPIITGTSTTTLIYSSNNANSISTTSTAAQLSTTNTTGIIIGVVLAFFLVLTVLILIVVVLIL